MRTAQLARLGVPSAVVETWGRGFGEDLLPVQVRAIEEGRILDDDGNLLIVAPTGSGKTAAAELALMKAVRDGKLGFYLVPTRPLADEKHTELAERYGPLGMRVVVSSRDRRDSDLVIARREFDIAVVVVEKLQALLVRWPDLLEHIGLLVVDELQMLGSGERGAALERLLAKLLDAPHRPRIIGLSAALGDPDAIADWLRARLVRDEHRPVELRKGVLCRGVYRAREHNSGAKRVERFEDHARGSADELIAHLARQLVERGEQVLVFVPDRRRSVGVARLLASGLETPPCDAALAELKGQRECLSRKALESTLARSVAFHNADLASEERAVVVRHFKTGGIRAIVSTNTLATGMNLPAQNVIIDPRRWRPSSRDDHWTLDRISRADYENVSGRAGRLCGTATFGRSILVTTSPFEAQLLEKQFVQADFAPIVPRLQFMSLEDPVLDLLAAGHSKREDMERMLLATYSGRVRWRRAPEELRRNVEAAIEACLRAGFIERRGPKSFRLSALGMASALTGVRFASTVALADWARTAVADVSPLEALLVAHLSPAGREIHVPLAVGEMRSGRHRAELARRAGDASVAHRPTIARLLAQPHRWDNSEERAAKKALVLLDRQAGATVGDIEQRYGVWAGALQRISEDTAWLVRGLAEITDALAWPGEKIGALLILADSFGRSRASSAEAPAPDTDRAPPTLRSARTPDVAKAGPDDVEPRSAA